MSQAGFESFGAYQKARELFDFVLSDMVELRKDSRCYRLIAQEVAKGSFLDEISEDFPPHTLPSAPDPRRHD